MRRRTLQVRDASADLAAFVAAETGLSPAAARALVERGAVYLDGKRCRDPRLRLKPGHIVTAVLEEAGRSAAAEPPATPAPELAILHQDGALLAVNKPAGLPSQPTPGGAANLLDLVGARLGRPAGLVHRLDRETSGVIVFGLTSAATRALAAQLREGTAHKQYLAVVAPGLPAAGRIDLPISRDPSRPGRYRATRSANGVPALTEYRRLREGEDHCLVELSPRTGRTHQLRAHLAAIGCPIAGDLRYGGAATVAGEPVRRCLLHARRLELDHPADPGRRLAIEAPLPPDLERFFRTPR
jgi:23S rRNA pseudouridine1911/1915/1917 synthase